MGEEEIIATALILALRKDDPNSLISEPFVDSLARIQQEKYLQNRTAKQENRKLRDKKLVATYLKSKFPDAFTKEMTVPDREFPRLLKLARNRYIKRIVAGATGVPVGISMIILGATFKAVMPFGAPLFFGGMATMIFCLIFGIIALIRFVDGE